MKKVFQLAFLFIFIIQNLSAQSGKHSFDVKVSGKGRKAIIFIPGFASSGDVWNGTKELFEKKYTCYVLTMPGFAGVQPQSYPSMSGWEDEIVSFIVANKINKPILIGHSMGGVMAMKIAADYPELPEKIVVVDALPCLPALMNASFKAKDTLNCAPMVKQFAGVSNEQFLKMQKAGAAQMVSDTVHQKDIVNWSMQSDRTTFAMIYCEFSNTDLRTKIASVTCPALIMMEPYFKNVEPNIQDQFKNLKTAKIQYAGKGLHFIMYDDVPWYNAELLEFIK